ncbi:monoheme cytochrome C [Pricia sp.]|uniref:monoheme cytochrome C n=1 Tax=Pricia sp. TaxID=2268138 RepID=UPI0035940EDE
MSEQNKFWKSSRRIYRFLIVVCVLALVSGIVIFYLNYGDTDTDKNAENEYTTFSDDDPDRIEDGIHVRTGLVDAPGLQETVNNCTSCHSAKLVMQNRMGAERWHATIRWMQKTQNLWPLGENEAIIVDYLVTNYPPKSKGRRETLADVDWYELR